MQCTYTEEWTERLVEEWGDQLQKQQALSSTVFDSP